MRGLAIPLGSYASQIHVLGFLASAGLPLAHRIERWVLDNAGDRLRRVTAFSELHGGHSQAEAWLPLGPDSGRAGGSIARAWTTGAPAINQQPGSEPGPPAAAAAAIGATGLLAIPIVREDSVSEVLVLYL